MNGFQTTVSRPPVELPEPMLARHWRQHGRAALSVFDQGLVSIASFVTNFLLLHHLANDKEHLAYYALALNLMIWVAEFHATLVFTPLTILTPRRSGQELRRFHGSTLLQHFGVSIVAMIAFLIAAVIVRPGDRDMSQALIALAIGVVVVGLRNYARPFSFIMRNPMSAVLVDLAVCVLQIGGVLLLAKFDRLTAASAVGVIAVASALPAVFWLLANRSFFSPGLKRSIDDMRVEWPLTRWVFFSGMVWNAGMSLYPWLITTLSGTIQVAVWFACYQLAAVANPLLMGLQNFTGPRIAEAFIEHDVPAFKRFVVRTALYTFGLMIGPAILLSIFASPLLTWMSKGQFVGHQLAITLLCAAILLQSVTFALSRGLFALHRADLDLYCNFGPLILLFTGGAWLTWKYGAEGAAMSMLIAQVLSSGSRAILFARVKHANPEAA